MMMAVMALWSCVAIVLWMTATKYRWTRPPWSAFVVFFLCGICSCLPALLVNSFLGRETELWPFSDNPLFAFLGFTIGAGISEELWKMLCGIMAVLLCQAGMRRRLYPADCAAGFTIAALGFAAFENLYAYSNVDHGLMFMRSLFAVPLHGGMGMLHGVAFNYAAKRGSAWPMFIGWMLAAAIHAWYDTYNIFFPNLGLMSVLAPTVLAIIFSCAFAWRRTPELPPDLMTAVKP